MEQIVIVSFLAFFALEFLVEFVLNEINMGYVRESRAGGNIPDLFQGRVSQEEYDKSVDYTLAKGRFERWAQVYGSLMTLFILFGGLLPYFDRLTRGLEGLLPAVFKAQGILFCFSVALTFSLLSLPTGLYSTFALEGRFGFNKTTLKLYLLDKLKGFLVSLVIGIPFLFGVLYLMGESGPYWWLWAFLFILAYEILMVILYPTLIAPLFNKFEPLKEGELRERILTLVGKTGFQTSGIYTMDGSRRSTHSNAYFTGLGRAKRIVLFDTLVEQMTAGQGLAVLAHEIGHYKMKHIRKMLLLQGLLLFAGLYLLSFLVGYEPLFRAFGLGPSSHAALVLFSLLSGPFTFYLTPVMNLVSRRHEYEADRFAVRTLEEGRAMEEALFNLTVKNLSNLTPHPWYSAYHYSHPSVVERIRAIRQEA
ncbi:MAG: M48 family metallopeptidase [Deltaproteobacteria bacterium]|nr:M48 family metallopeptidase [Deltaproteobacteria bacterium]